MNSQSIRPGGLVNQSVNQSINPYIKQSVSPNVPSNQFSYANNPYLKKSGAASNQPINQILSSDHANNDSVIPHVNSTSSESSLSSSPQISHTVNKQHENSRSGSSASVNESTGSSKSSNHTNHSKQSGNISSPSSSDQTMTMSRYAVFCAHKAGMQSVDQSTVNDTVFNLSKNSAHFAQALTRDKQVSVKISTMVNQAKNLSTSQVNTLRSKADAIIRSMESERVLDRVWCHIDLDSFFASVELLDRPDLLDKPVAVGGMSMISTSNYVARQFGVRAAMPGFIGLKLCPSLILIKPDFAKYKAAAAVFRKVFAMYDEMFESYSLDEAYLDLTAVVQERVKKRLSQSTSNQPTNDSVGSSASSVVEPENQQPMCLDSHSSVQATSDPSALTDQPINLSEYPELRDEVAAEVACEIRERVQQETRLTCSAGVAPNRMLAKMCTDVNKPNGQFILKASAADILSFLDPQKVRKIPGVGKVMERILNELGIHSIGQIRAPQFTPLLLTGFSEITYMWLLRAGLGIGRVEHETEEDSRRKSISTERTFHKISTVQALEAKLNEIAHLLAGDIEKYGSQSSNNDVIDDITSGSTSMGDSSNSAATYQLDQSTNQSAAQPITSSASQSASQSSKPKLRGKTLTLKLKTSSFEIKQRSVTHSTWIHSYEQIHRIGLMLLREELNSLRSTNQATNQSINQHSLDGLLELRLMGLRLSSLDPSMYQSVPIDSAGSIRRFAFAMGDDEIDDDEIEVIERSSGQSPNATNNRTNQSVSQSIGQSIGQSVNNRLSGHSSHQHLHLSSPPSKRARSTRKPTITAFFDVNDSYDDDNSDSDLCFVEEPVSSISQPINQPVNETALATRKRLEAHKSTIVNYLHNQPINQSTYEVIDESDDDDDDIDEMFDTKPQSINQSNLLINQSNRSVNQSNHRFDNQSTGARQRPTKRTRVTLESFLKPQKMQKTTIDLID